MLSDAVPEIVTDADAVEYEDAEVGAPIVIVGAVESDAEYVTVKMSVPTFPAASRALTVMTFEPTCNPMDDAAQLVVPDALPPPPRLLLQLTDETPTLSEALPPIEIVAPDVVKLAAAVGDAIEIAGAVESAVVPVVTVHVNVCAGD
jgi:hypothetical protein